MRLIENKAEIIQQEDGLNGLYKHIETCGRVPYKSYDKSDGTIEGAKAFIDRMIASKHFAVLEQGTVYLYLEINPDNCDSHFDYPLASFMDHYNWSDVISIIVAKYKSNKYSKVITKWLSPERSSRGVYITTNYRVIVENDWQDDLQFICNPTEFHFKRVTFKVNTSIGITREINRSRSLSVLEQSTRYCNYTKDKFDNEISFCKPSWINLNLGKYELNFDNGRTIVGDGYIRPADSLSEDSIFLEDCLTSELTYKQLVSEHNYSPQQAREILPLCTATEAVYTAFLEDWTYFFNLRLLEVTGKVHPNMKDIAYKMHKAMVEVGLLDDLCKNY